MQGNASGGERAQWAGKMANVLVDAAQEVVAKKSVIPERPPCKLIVYRITFRMFIFRLLISI